LLATLSATQLI